MTTILRLLVPVVFVVLLASFAPAQEKVATPFTVGENRRVNGASVERPLVEPQVVAHPKDPQHLLAVAIVSSEPPFSAQADCAAFVSFDGGKTWSQHNFGVPNCGDPWVTLRADGVALFAALVPRGEIRIFRSTDGGRGWSPLPVDLGRGHDHQTLVADHTSGVRAGNLYVVSGRTQRDKAARVLASVFVTRSADGGKTFVPPTNFVPSNLNNNVLTPGVLSDGTLVVPFIDYQDSGGDHSPTAELDRRRVWAITSSDGGQTFSHPLFVSEACGSRGGFASLAVDSSSGSSRDRLYLVCTNRERDGVLVHNSTDRGARWSAPVRADSARGDVVFRRTPSIAVNKDGVVAVTWYERRKEAGKDCQHIFFTASLDGGKTFLPETRVSSTLSCPDTPRNGGSATRWPAGGDYSGLVAAADGSFQVVWADSRSGMYELWIARVEIKATALR